MSLTAFDVLFGVQEMEFSYPYPNASYQEGVSRTQSRVGAQPMRGRNQATLERLPLRQAEMALRYF
jgi:hypothetical protein